MRGAVPVKKSPKAKVVIHKAVSLSFRAYNGLKRHLEPTEHVLEESSQIFVSNATETLDATKDATQAKKLFLHNSVSRMKPDKQKLEDWIKQLKVAPSFQLNECLITLIQPNTKRPGRTFFNPKKKTKARL